jgi:hypothetical protein
MEGLIILGLIGYGIYLMSGGGCNHEWGWGNQTHHECNKCGKKEKHDISKFINGFECDTCGHYWDGD